MACEAGCPSVVHSCSHARSPVDLAPHTAFNRNSTAGIFRKMRSPEHRPASPRHRADTPDAACSTVTGACT
eukprot:5813611-Prymnesium_polylepis.1